MNRSLIFLAVFCAFFVYACKESESSNNNNSNNTNTLTAVIGGVPWTATMATISKDQNTFVITGMTSVDTLQFRMIADTGLVAIPQAKYMKGVKQYHVGDGGAKVSLLTSSNVQGTFNVGVNDTTTGTVITISSGSFNLYY